MQITEDGMYSLDNKIDGSAGDSSVIYLSGPIGTANCTFVYFDLNQNIVPYTDEPLLSESVNTLDHGHVLPYLQVVGSNEDTTINVKVAPLALVLKELEVPSIIGKVFQSTSAKTGIWVYPRWLNRYKGTLPATLNITNSLTDLTGYLGSFIKTNQPPEATFISYEDTVTPVFKFTPNTSHYLGINIELALSGSVAIQGSNSSESELLITRPNGEIIRRVEYSRVADSPTTFTKLSMFSLSSFIFEGGVDPFQVDGFKIQLQTTAGNSIELSGQQELRIHSN